MADSKIPRRICIDRMTPAERAITDAMYAVEKAGGDPLLTDAVNLLSKARDKVADYVDGRLSLEDDIKALAKKHGVAVTSQNIRTIAFYFSNSPKIGSSDD